MLIKLMQQIKDNINKVSHYDIGSALPKFLDVLANWQNYSNQLILEICEFLKSMAESKFITLLLTKKLMQKLISILLNVSIERQDIVMASIVCIRAAVGKLHLRRKMTEIGVFAPLQKLILTSVD